MISECAYVVCDPIYSILRIPIPRRKIGRKIKTKKQRKEI